MPEIPGLLTIWTNSLVRIALIASLALAAGCDSAHIVRVAVPDLGFSAEPFLIVEAKDGGIFMAVETIPATLLKLKDDGSIEWKFEESQNNGGATISMVTALPDGGALVCGGRRSRPPDREVLPGFVIRLDSHGKEISRLDPLVPGFVGKSFYETDTCAQWGDGFVISAMESTEEARSNIKPFDAYKNNRIVVSRLSPSLSITWIKPIQIRGLGITPFMPPREMANGDLLFPSEGDIFLLDGQGTVKVQARMGPCSWLHTREPDKLKFVCTDLDVGTEARIVEYDLNLNEISSTQLSGAYGWPSVAELPTGYLAVFGEPNSSGPPIVSYDQLGRELNRYTLPRGDPRGLIVSSLHDEIVVAQAAVRNGHLVPKLIWLNH